MPANRTQPRLDFGTAGNWNAIEARAHLFVERWNDTEGYEKGESQHFWSEFLALFGIDHKRAGAFFEYRTRKLSGAPGFVDLFEVLDTLESERVACDLAYNRRTSIPNWSRLND